MAHSDGALGPTVRQFRIRVLILLLHSCVTLAITWPLWASVRLNSTYSTEFLMYMRPQHSSWYKAMM